MISSAWSRLSTGSVVSSSHSSVSFQTRTPPHPDRRAARWTVTRRQKLQLAPGDADDDFALLGQDRGGTHRAGRAQRRQRSAAGGQPSVLGRANDRIPAGIAHALQMLEDVGAPVRDRDETTARRRTADRCDRFGPDR